MKHARPKVAPLSAAEAVAVARMTAYQSLRASSHHLVHLASLDEGSFAGLREEIDDASLSPSLRPEHARVVDVPMATASESNMREHWSVRYSRSNRQQEIMLPVLRSYVGVRPPPAPALITLTLLYPEAAKRRDLDNAWASVKAVQDATALGYFGLDDADPRLLFVVRRENAGKVGLRLGVQWGWSGVVGNPTGASGPGRA